MKALPFFFAVALTSLGLLNAQDAPKIAVVDLTKVFEAHPKTATATAELTKARDDLRDEWVEKTNGLKGILQKHQEAIRAGKRDEAGELLKEANEAEKAIATLKTTQQRDLEQNFIKQKTEILKAIQEAVAKYNADKKFALVVDKSAVSENGLPMVLDASGATDITAEIIEQVKGE